MTSRLEKKCFLGSASLHGALLLVFVLSTAFLSSKSRDVIGPVVTLVAIPTDKDFNTGGNPNGNPEPPAPAPQPLQPTPQPPPPQPKPEPEPPQPEPPKQEKPKPKEQAKKDVPKPEPKKELVKEVEKEKGPLPVAKDKKEITPKNNTSAKPPLNTKLVKRTNSVDTAASEKTRTAQAAKDKADRQYREDLARYNQQRQRLADSVNGIVGGVGKSLSSSTVVEPLGSGGAAFVNYGSLVREIYDRAWMVPQGLADDDSTARAKIVIARDGRVISATLSQRSGNTILDKSVQRALDAVQTVAPFPEGTTDRERTFNINFNLRAKRFSA